MKIAYYILSDKTKDLDLVMKYHLKLKPNNNPFYDFKNKRL